MVTSASVVDEKELRKLAVQRLRQRRGFISHLLTFVLISGFLTLIWGLNNTHSFYWPVYPIAFWAMVVVLHGWTAFRRVNFSEADIQKQMSQVAKN